MSALLRRPYPSLENANSLWPLSRSRGLVVELSARSSGVASPAADLCADCGRKPGQPPFQPANRVARRCSRWQMTPSSPTPATTRRRRCAGHLLGKPCSTAGCSSFHCNQLLWQEGLCVCFYCTAALFVFVSAERLTESQALPPHRQMHPPTKNGLPLWNSPPPKTAH